MAEAAVVAQALLYRMASVCVEVPLLQRKGLRVS